MSNFGIVIHYTMRAIPQGKMFGVELTFIASKLATVTTAVYELTINATNTSFSYYYGYSYNQNSNSFSISMNEAYVPPIANLPVFLALNFIEHESDTLRIDWMSNFSVEMADSTPSGGRYVFSFIHSSMSLGL